MMSPSLKAWVAHDPVVRSFGVLIGWRRIYRLRTRVRDEFLRPATRVLHALLPLLSRELGVRKVLQLLREAVR